MIDVFLLLEEELQVEPYPPYLIKIIDIDNTTILLVLLTTC